MGTSQPPSHLAAPALGRGRGEWRTIGLPQLQPGRGKRTLMQPPRPGRWGRTPRGAEVRLGGWTDGDVDRIHCLRQINVGVRVLQGAKITLPNTFGRAENTNCLSHKKRPKKGPQYIVFIFGSISLFWGSDSCFFDHLRLALLQWDFTLLNKSTYALST